MSDLPPTGGTGLEPLLPTLSKTVRCEEDRIRQLLPDLEFVSRLLGEVPQPIEAPALVFRDELGKVRAQPVRTRLRVGRLPECDISFPNYREVSRYHFAITESAGEFVLADAGSSNGTFLRRKEGRVENCPLLDGDIIDAGGFVFVFIKH